MECEAVMEPEKKTESRTRCAGFLRRKEVWTLSLRGWLAAFAFALAVLLAVFFRVHPFLAVNNPVPADVLVVEGWVPAYALVDAWHYYQDGHYRLLLTTGSLCRDAVNLDPDDTYARISAAALKKMFGHSAQIQPVPAPLTGRERTYTSALALKEWLRLHEPAVTSVNVVTMATHARRTRLLFAKALGPGFQVGVMSVQDQEYDPRHWWRYSQGIKEVLSEGSAYLYARFLFHP
ncbi:MAG: ElyC/SanA/YdcF family protein [Verrucomicrobiota bacterium]